MINRMNGLAEYKTSALQNICNALVNLSSKISEQPEISKKLLVAAVVM